jgi:hypothetical protein
MHQRRDADSIDGRLNEVGDLLGMTDGQDASAFLLERPHRLSERVGGDTRGLDQGQGEIPAAGFLVREAGSQVLNGSSSSRTYLD